MHVELGVSPGVHSQLYSIAFLNSFLSMISLFLSSYPRLPFSVLLPESWKLIYFALPGIFHDSTSVCGLVAERYMERKTVRVHPTLLGLRTIITLPSGEEVSPTSEF